LVLELKQGKWRWLFVFLPWGDFIPQTDGWYSDNINALFHTKTVQWSILMEPIYWICSFIENLYRLMQNPPKPAVNLGLLSPWERKTHIYACIFQVCKICAFSPTKTYRTAVKLHIPCFFQRNTIFPANKKIFTFLQVSRSPWGQDCHLCDPVGLQYLRPWIFW